MEDKAVEAVTESWTGIEQGWYSVFADVSCRHPGSLHSHSCTMPFCLLVNCALSKVGREWCWT